LHLGDVGVIIGGVVGGVGVGVVGIVVVKVVVVVVTIVVVKVCTLIGERLYPAIKPTMPTTIAITTRIAVVLFTESSPPALLETIDTLWGI